MVTLKELSHRKDPLTGGHRACLGLRLSSDRQSRPYGIEGSGGGGLRDGVS